MRQRFFSALLLSLIPLLVSLPAAAQLHSPMLLGALSPSLNLSPEQLAIAARRSRLPLASKLECSALDTRLPRLQRAARRAQPAQKAEAAQALLQARQRYENLGC